MQEDPPKYGGSNYRKISILGDGDCGYYSLIHGLLLIKRDHPHFDLKFLDGLRLANDRRTVKYPDWAVSQIKNLINADDDHWLETDDFPIVTGFWNICILTWDRNSKIWWHHKSPNIWESLPGLYGCEHVLFFHHQLTRDGDGDHWSLLTLKTDWQPPEPPAELLEFYERQDLIMKFKAVLNNSSDCKRDTFMNYENPEACRKLLLALMTWHLSN